MEAEGHVLDLQLRFPPSILRRARGSALRQWFVPAATCQTVGDVVSQIKEEFDLAQEELVLLRNQARFRASLPAAIFRCQDVLYIERVAGVASPGIPGCIVCGCVDEEKFSHRQLKPPLGLSSGKARCRRCVKAGSDVGGSVLKKTEKGSDAATESAAASFSMDSASLADTLESVQPSSGIGVRSMEREGSGMGRSDVAREEASLESGDWDGSIGVSACQDLESVSSSGSTKSMAVEFSSCAMAVEVMQRFNGVQLEGRPLQVQAIEEEFGHEFGVEEGNGVVRVSNIPLHVSEEDIEVTMGQVGTVLSVWELEDEDWEEQSFGEEKSKVGGRD